MSDGDPPPFEVKVTPDGQQVVVSAAGEVDLTTAGELERAIADPLDRGVRTVVVDLRQVTFLDSSGIRALVTVDERAKSLGARLPMVLAGPAVQRPLELSGLVERFEIAPDSMLNGPDLSAAAPSRKTQPRRRGPTDGCHTPG